MKLRDLIPLVDGGVVIDTNDNTTISIYDIEFCKYVITHLDYKVLSLTTKGGDILHIILDNKEVVDD